MKMTVRDTRAGAGRGRTAVKGIILGLCLALLMTATAEAQSPQDEASLRRLPQTFSDAFNKHDARLLGALLAEDVDFVTTDLTWLVGRADFQTYHARLFEGRFREITHTVLAVHVRFLRPDSAVVRHSWSVQGEKNADGSPRAPRYGLMTMMVERREGTWVVAAVQNTTGPTGPPTTSREGTTEPPFAVPRPAAGVP